MRIFFTGVGGQGTLLATRLVGEAGLEQGLRVGMSEIHGMAQRGGVVESSVVMGEVSSPPIPDGEADILMAFEPLEAARALPKCNGKTLAVTSTVPIVPFTVATGQSAYPSLESLFEAVEKRVARFVKVDAVELSKKAGSDRAGNIVMVGVLAGLGWLPIDRPNWEQALRKILPAKILDENLKAFHLGYEAGAAAK